MTRAFISLLLTFSIFTTFGQEHGGLLSQETLLKNRVHTIFQYSVTDSVQFMKDYPNGYYSIFNEDGRMIEANNYSQSFDENGESIWNEYKNFYFYNDAGNRIGLIQMYTDSEEPFRVIHLTSFDSESNKVHTVDLETNSDLEAEFVFREEEFEEKKLFFGDTVSIEPFHKRTYVVSDSTMFEDIYFDANNRIDSTVFHSISYGKIGSHPSYLKTLFHYDENGTLINKIRQHSSETPYSEPHMTMIVKFSSSGLIESIETHQAKPESVELMKYTYTFRE